MTAKCETNPGEQRPWTAKELRELREYARQGAVVIAVRLGRTVRAVRAAAARNGISLRRAGERRGLIVGQPRGVSFTGSATPKLVAEHRRTVLDGAITRETFEIVSRREWLDRTEGLCPTCTERPQEVAATGLCRTCHLGRLADQHREAQELHKVQRRYNRAKQGRKRARERSEGA